MKECTGAAKEKCGEHDELQAPIAAEQEFIFLRLNVLREYLYNELTMTGLPFQQDLERAIDDWVLMCFFVGNDFLPHLPSLEIREGAIDRLIRLYKQAVYKTGGYLTENGSVNLARVQLILTELGEVEDEIFKKRRETDLEFKRRDRERNKRQRRSEGNAPMWRTGGQYEPAAVGGRVAPISNPHQTVLEMRQQAMKFSSSSPSQNQSNRDAAAQLKAQIHGNDQGVKRKSDVMEAEDDEAEPNDEVKLWEDGWKDRYYQSKFGVGPEDLKFRHTVGNAYVLGMCWVFKYYYQGCASWDWYFPYHYAPFASDFVNIGDLNTEFEPGTKPFRPLEQLMSVFPAASKQFLPPSWQTLMEDPESPIIDFYPEDFRIDLNGKKYAWQGVALLPFVDEQRLLETLSEVYPHLTALETRRNTLGSDKLFIGSKHPARDFSVALYEGEPCNASNPIELDPSLTSGVRGNMWCDEHAVIPSNAYTSPLPQCEDFVNSGAISVNFRDPQYAEGFIFPVKMLKNAKMPERVLKPEDFNRRYPGQQYRPQIGFNRNSGHRPTDPSAANRFIRAGVGSYSNVAPPGRFMTPPGRSGSNYGAPQPPMSWQRSLQGQATAYNRNQQQLGHQHTGYGPPRGYGSQRPSFDTASGSGYGVQRASPYGSHSGYSRSQSSIESYSTRGGSAYPGGSYQNEQRGRQSHYPYPPQRRY
jgi:5'-3' exoribonuclease 2